MFEGLPTWPDCGRYWSIVDQYRVTKFYTAPTVIRMLIGAGDEYVRKYDRSSLKVKRKRLSFTSSLTIRIVPLRPGVSNSWYLSCRTHEFINFNAMPTGHPKVWLGIYNLTTPLLINFNRHSNPDQIILQDGYAQGSFSVQSYFRPLPFISAC